VRRRGACVIRPVRSRPSAAPSRIRASNSASSSCADLSCAASARRALSTDSPMKGLLTLRSRPRTLGCELRSLVLRGQRIDQLADCFSGNHLRQLVERQIDAMVSDPSLREVISADALAAIAGADLLLAFGRADGIDALLLGVVDARAQDVHGGRA